MFNSVHALHGSAGWGFFECQMNAPQSGLVTAKAS